MTIARLMQMAAAGSAGAGPEPSGWTDPDLANASYDSVSFSVAGRAAYRQALRDVTAQTDFPYAVIWPTKP